jgi:hypothetical protein
MVPVDEATIARRARWGRAQMISPSIWTEGKLYHDREIKDRLAASAALWRVGRARSSS